MGGKENDKKNSVYDESKIKTLSSLEHIRLRTGMYIGRLGDGTNQNDGIYILLKEVVDNAIDEFIMGNGTQIEVEVKENTVKVRDYGRGIPLGKLYRPSGEGYDHCCRVMLSRLSRFCSGGYFVNCFQIQILSFVIFDEPMLQLCYIFSNL